MKRLLWIAVLLAGLVSAQASEIIPSKPDYTLLWHRFNSVVVVDTFLMATSEQSLTVHQTTATSTEFRYIKSIYLNSAPVTQRRFGNVLAVKTASGVMEFFDLSTLPDLQPLGQVDVGVEAVDYALKDRFLYVSFGFEGVKRYELTGYSSAHFLDSCLEGINYRQLELAGDTLYAADDYNGLMRYIIDSTGLPHYFDILYLPFQVRLFRVVDSQVIISSRNTFVAIADLKTSPPMQTDSISLVISASTILTGSDFAVVLDSATAFARIVLMDGSVGGLCQLTESAEPNLRGVIARVGNKDYVVLPSRVGGVMLYSIEDLTRSSAVPLAATHQRGSITGVVMHDGHIVTGGARNAVDIFDYAPGAAPSLNRTLFNGLNRVNSLHQVGDSLYVYYPQLRRALVFQVESDTTYYRASYFVDSLYFQSVRFNAARFDTLRPLLAVGKMAVGVFSISDAGISTYCGAMNIFERIFDVEMVDSLVAISTGTSIWIYRLYNDFSTEYRFTIVAGDSVHEMRPFQGHLMLFSGTDVLLADPNQPANPIIDTLAHLPSPTIVYGSAAQGQYLTAVGSGGLAVFDMSSQPFQLVAYGGRAGYQIAMENNIAVVSDSASLHVYNLSFLPTGSGDTPPRHTPGSFALRQNYPNPFNPSTTIRFNLSSRAYVTLEVFNLLGQRVRVLYEGVCGSGEHEVVWDGTDNSHRAVATGVYLYRLAAGAQSETRKMVLMK